ncbi:MAG: ComEC family competence protein [Bacteroidetes bacterium]|nr:ComEC family competence protein [Bacteroidota bacterium]
MTNKIFGSIFFGFLVGVAIASLFQINIVSIFFFSILAVVFIILAHLKFLPKRKTLLISVFLLFVSVGSLRFYIKDSAEQKNLLDNFIDEKITLTGVIKNEVESRQNSQRFILKAENLNFKNKDYKIDSNVLVSTELFPKFSYGDKIFVQGELKNPENFLTDNGREFDYKNYLRKDSIFYTMSFAKIQYLSSGNGNIVKEKILFVKDKFLNSIEKIIPSPESSLLSGLLLGVKESLGKNLEQHFINAGLVHIVVLSGYNVTIIAEAIISALSFASVFAGIYIGGIAILIFAVMTGAGATIIRASIMAILALVARALGRSYEIERIIMVTAFAMVMQNPYILVFDISFELSFLATLGLIYLSPVFEKAFRFLPKRFSIREIISSTLATQLFVLPFILYKIGNLSLVAPFTNVLVLPFIPATMFFGFLSGFFGFFNIILGIPFGFIAYILLKFEIFIVELFSKLTFSSVTIYKFPFILVLASYAAFVWWIFKWRKKNEKSL